MDRKRQINSNRRSRSRERLRTPPPPRIRHSPRLERHNSESRLHRRRSPEQDQRSPPHSSRRLSIGYRSRLSPRRLSRRPSPKPNRRRNSPIRQSSPGPSKSYRKREESPDTRTNTNNNNRCQEHKDNSENLRFHESDLKNIKVKVQNLEKSVIIVRQPGERTKSIFDREEIKTFNKKYDEENGDRIRQRENDSRSPLVRRSRSRSRGRRSPRNFTVSPNRERNRGGERRYASADRLRDAPERRSREHRERSPRRERPYEAGPPIRVPHPVPLPGHFVPPHVYWGYPNVRPIARPIGPPFPRFVRGRRPEFVILPPPPHGFVRVPPPHIRPGPPRY